MSITPVEFADTIRLSEEQSVLELTGRNILSNTLDIDLNGKSLSTSEYELDVLTGTIRLLLEYDPPATLLITYQSLPIDIPSYYFKRRMSLDAARTVIDRTVESPAAARGSAPLTTGSKLRIFGSKSIGVSTGSVSSFELNQTMNIQIEGRISENLRVRGVLSDQSRPDVSGVSTTIGEVDKIALSVESDRFRGTIGDITLARTLGTTATLNKAMKGARAVLEIDKYRAEITAGGIKSKHQIVKLSGREGVLGPYSLRPSNGRESSSILPGTETVWLDGRRMERGADADYDIDYLLGKLTFNPTVMITSRSRIEVDFEYLDESYQQNLYSGSVAFGDSIGRGFFAEVGVLRQADSKENPSRIELTPADVQALKNAGDATAVRSGAVRADSNEGRYNIEISEGDTVYVFVDSLGDYNVSFSFVGAESGSYVYVGGGRYSWIGEGNGSYDPIVFLQSPRKSDVVIVTTELNRSRVSLELSGMLSDYDRNLFSNTDDGDNVGSDLRSHAQFRILNPADTASPSLSLAVRAARVEAEFFVPGKQFEVERERRWSLQTDSVYDAASEIDVSLVSASRYIDLTAGVGAYDDPGSVNADRYGFALALKPLKLFKLTAGRSDRTASGDAISKSTRLLENSLSAAVTSKTAGLRVDYKSEVDTRGVLIESKGRRYDRYSAQARLRGFTLSGAYEERDVLSDSWEREKNTRELRVSYEGAGGLPGSSADVGITTRRVHEFDDGETRGSQFLASSDYRVGSRTGLYDLAFNLRIGRQSLDRQAATYLRVGEGEGDYRLENGVYVPDDFGNYIRVEELITDDRVGISLSSGLTFRAELSEWTSCPEDLSFLRRVSLETHLRAREEGDDGEDPTLVWFMPYVNSFSDRSLLREKSLRQVARTKLSDRVWLYLSVDEIVRFFPRQSPPLSDYRISFVERFDITLPRSTTVSPEHRFKRVDESSSFSGRADFVEHHLRAPFKWRIRRGYEVIVTPGYLQAESRNDQTNATRWEGGLEGRMSAGKSGRFTAHLSYYRVDSDQASIPFQFAGGKKIGDNFDWAASLDIRLSKLVSGRIIYNGEKLPGLDTRHRTSVGVRARF